MVKPSLLISYLCSRALSVLALQTMATAIVLRALKLGAGPWELGQLGLAATLASLATSLPLGQLVDQMDRRVSILVAHLALILLAVSFVFLKSPNFLSLIILSGLIASFRNFRSISQFAVFGEILSGLPKPEKWINLSTLSWQIAAFAAPILASAIDVRWGGQACFMTAAAFFALAFLCQTKIVPALNSVRQKAEAAPVHELVSFFYRNEKLRSALLLDFVVVLFAGSTAILPFLHPNQSGSFEVGLLRSALPCGVMLGTILVLRKPLTGDWKKWLFIATFGFGLSHFLLSLSPLLIISYLLLIVAGLFDAVSLSVREVLLQVETPQRIKGRVYSLNNFLVNASDELSEWESGVAAYGFGLKRSLQLGAGVTMLAAGYFGVKQLKTSIPSSEAVSPA